MYYMQIGYKKHYFKTLKRACEIAEKIRIKTGVIMGVVKE